MNTFTKNKGYFLFFMYCRTKLNKIKINNNIYVEDGEGLNIATLRCNI